MSSYSWLPDVRHYPSSKRFRVLQILDGRDVAVVVAGVVAVGVGVEGAAVVAAAVADADAVAGVDGERPASGSRHWTSMRQPPHWQPIGLDGVNGDGVVAGDDGTSGGDDCSSEA